MKSKINILKFRNRLQENTKIGRPSLKIKWGILSIFADTTHSFYGKFDNSTFELITNSNFFISFYQLTGTYKKTEENTIVNYNIQPIDKLGVGRVKYFPFIALIMFNCIFYFQLKPPIKIYILFTAFIIFSSLLMKLVIKWQNRNLKKKFNEIFEITD